MNTNARDLVNVLSRITDADLEHLQRHELRWINDRLHQLQTQTRERLHGKSCPTAALFAARIRPHRETTA